MKLKCRRQSEMEEVRIMMVRERGSELERGGRGMRDADIDPRSV